MATYTVGDTTETELIEALMQAGDCATGYEGLRTEDIAEATGWSIKKVRRILKPLIRAGVVAPHKVKIVGMHGDTASSTAYQLVDACDE